MMKGEPTLKGEQGFTLLEMVITVAISGLIVGFLGTAIFQMITVADRGGDKMLAMHELENAAHWVTRDGQMARMAVGGNSLVLTLPLPPSHGLTVTYSLDGTDLRRHADGDQRIIARNISHISFTVQKRIITMNITSSPAGRANVSESGIYKIHLRPTE